ncbi:hypothetical protein KCV07_g276, partial [Aureobasidium melanogenum]
MNLSSSSSPSSSSSSSSSWPSSWSRLFRSRHKRCKSSWRRRLINSNLGLLHCITPAKPNDLVYQWNSLCHSLLSFIQFGQCDTRLDVFWVIVDNELPARFCICVAIEHHVAVCKLHVVVVIACFRHGSDGLVENDGFCVVSLLDQGLGNVPEQIKIGSADFDAEETEFDTQLQWIFALLNQIEASFARWISGKLAELLRLQQEVELLAASIVIIRVELDRPGETSPLRNSPPEGRVTSCVSTVRISDSRLSLIIVIQEGLRGDVSLVAILATPFSTGDTVSSASTSATTSSTGHLGIVFCSFDCPFPAASPSSSASSTSATATFTTTSRSCSNLLIEDVVQNTLQSQDLCEDYGSAEVGDPPPRIRLPLGSSSTSESTSMSCLGINPSCIKGCGLRGIKPSCIRDSGQKQDPGRKDRVFPFACALHQRSKNPVFET